MLVVLNGFSANLYFSVLVIANNWDELVQSDQDQLTSIGDQERSRKVDIDLCSWLFVLVIAQRYQNMSLLACCNR